MGKKSQFEKGTRVKSVFNTHDEYLIVDIYKNELKVFDYNTGTNITCKKSLFVAKENNLENTK